MLVRSMDARQRAELWTLNVSSGRRDLRHQSSTLVFEAPNWSIDGRTLLINAEGKLFTCPAAGPGELQEVHLGGIPPINNDHVLSPDGADVYVSADDGHLYVVNLRSGRPHRITNDRGSGFIHFLHGVSPDGDTLAYVGMDRRPDGSVVTNVFTIPSKGGQDTQLTDDSYADDGPEFSPDGDWIYFNSERGSVTPGHSQLFRMAARGGAPEQLTDDERVNWFPHLSPDGARIVYVSFAPGTIGHPENRDVVIRLLPQNGETRDLVSTVGGQGTMNVPSWSPDGEQFAYVAYPRRP